MTPREKAQQGRAAEIARGEKRWHFLSFANDERFLGGLLIKAFGPHDAMLQSHERGLNPGGSVRMLADPKGDHVPPGGYTNRLLSKAEVEELDRILTQ